jgi:DNA-binding HxlR family transcriptional regulator
MAKSMLRTTECDERMRCVQSTMEVLGGKWKVKIIIILYFGEANFMELHRQVTGIGTKMLSQDLKQMEYHGIVKRTVKNSRPITVTYELTAYGVTLKDIVMAMEAWGRQHLISTGKPH